MITINIQEAKTWFSALLAAVQKNGEIVLICRHGTPIAELRRPTALRPENPSRLTPDPALAGRLLYDPTEPAAEDEWLEGAR